MILLLKWPTLSSSVSGNVYLSSFVSFSLVHVIIVTNMLNTRYTDSIACIRTDGSARGQPALSTAIHSLGRYLLFIILLIYYYIFLSLPTTLPSTLHLILFQVVLRCESMKQSPPQRSRTTTTKVCAHLTSFLFFILLDTCKLFVLFCTSSLPSIYLLLIFVFFDLILLLIQVNRQHTNRAKEVSSSRGGS